MLKRNGQANGQANGRANGQALLWRSIFGVRAQDNLLYGLRA